MCSDRCACMWWCRSLLCVFGLFLVIVAPQRIIYDALYGSLTAHPHYSFLLANHFPIRICFMTHDLLEVDLKTDTRNKILCHFFSLQNDACGISYFMRTLRANYGDAWRNSDTEIEYRWKYHWFLIFGNQNLSWVLYLFLLVEVDACISHQS